MGWVGNGVIGRGLVVLVCSASAVGCSKDDDKPASEVCKDYVASYCAKAVSCVRETDRSDFSELCDFTFEVYLPCDQATRVWRNPQTCQEQISAIRCADVEPGSFPPSPEACQGLLGNQ